MPVAQPYVETEPSSNEVVRRNLTETVAKVMQTWHALVGVVLTDNVGDLVSESNTPL